MSGRLRPALAALLALAAAPALAHETLHEVSRGRAVAVRAYLADGEHGLQVVDIADPATPHVGGAVDTPGHAVNVALAGDRAYVADDDQGLQVIDIANPQWQEQRDEVERVLAEIGAAGIPQVLVCNKCDLLDETQRLAAEAVEPQPMTPAAFARYIRDDIARWTGVARERGIQLDS